MSALVGETRFSDSCGAEIPRWIRKRLMSLGDDKAAIMEFGISVLTTVSHHPQIVYI